ncbi:o-succinylbenzoate--CoA ligase, partial [Vibrio vulnificus]|nr:o-succinylbenzoate--CoA ligase [Vibrio vulnificus]
GIDTWLGYGMTEAASTVTAKRVDGLAGNGELLDHRELRLVDGRIFIAGKTLAQGYYRQGQLVPLTNEQGWFDSKDLGR